EPIKIHDIDKDGYSLVFVFQGGRKYGQKDDYIISFSPLCSDFKIFHNDKLIYQQHNINTYFMSLMKSQKEPSKKIERPD
ncbi:13183_t:CDS:1, partial [Cetraspora pellucida]